MLVNGARSAFVTQVTHELRAPLTNIRLCAETVIDDNESDPQTREQCLNVINQEAKRLERVVNDMTITAAPLSPRRSGLIVNRKTAPAPLSRPAAAIV